MADETNRRNENGAPRKSAEETASERSNSRARRFLLLTLVGAAMLLIAVMLLLQLFVAQRIPELTEERLEAAQAVWEESGPASYDMDIEIRGAQPGEVQIEVRSGQVTKMARDGRSPPPRTWEVWSVPGMFDTLERELVLAEDPQHEMNATAGARLQLRCEFDPHFGYPRRYHRFATGGAPEVFWRVTRFEVRESEQEKAVERKSGRGAAGSLE